MGQRAEGKGKEVGECKGRGVEPRGQLPPHPAQEGPARLQWQNPFCLIGKGVTTTSLAPHPLLSTQTWWLAREKTFSLLSFLRKERLKCCRPFALGCVIGGHPSPLCMDPCLPGHRHRPMCHGLLCMTSRPWRTSHTCAHLLIQPALVRARICPHVPQDRPRLVDRNSHSHHGLGLTQAPCWTESI